MSKSQIPGENLFSDQIAFHSQKLKEDVHIEKYLKR